MVRTALAFLVLVLVAPASAPVAAKVHETSANGFVLRHAIEVPATLDASWEMFVTPSKWWSKTHSFSRDAANFSLDPRAGGCFCEILPSKISPNAAPRGSVEHLRVVYVEQPRAMRLTGSLGPLQSSGVNGMLTVFFRPVDGGGTRILMEYVVGGYLRKDPQALATTVDLILAEQILRLGKTLGRVNADAPSASDSRAKDAEAKSDFEREMEAGLADPSPGTDQNSANGAAVPVSGMFGDGGKKPVKIFTPNPENSAADTQPPVFEGR